MRQLTLAILLILISGCGQENKESRHQKIVENKITTIQTTESIDSLRDPCSSYYLADKNSKEIGQMILDDSVRPTDNDVTFRIMDSLLAKKIEDRKFYFKVYAKILDNADGALAEVVGIPGMKYVENHTQEFIELSTNLTNKQLDSWANFIGWEILFDSHQDPLKGGENFIKKLVSNCVDLDSLGKKHLNDFNKMIIHAIEESKDDK
jgi:hypothetical protein